MRKLVFLLSLLLITPVLASECSTVLVGVMEVGDGFEGVLANLSVTVLPGSGNVWVDTMPLTKIETQVSARLAREVSCELLSINCSNLDFYYYMRSDYPLVGGPSAGAPMTVCTIAALLNLTVYPDVAMTGTINPDGSIGPVGSIPAKALILDDYRYFLVPEGYVIEDDLSVELIEVLDVVEAFNYYTDHELILENVSSEEIVSNDFVNAMKLMDESLLTITGSELSGLIAEELFNQSKDFYENESFYSSASYSVRSLIYSFYDKVAIFNESPAEVSELISDVSERISVFRDEFVSGLVIDHLYDLESFAITMDRIREAEGLVRDAMNATSLDESLFLQSFAEARLITAIEWSSLMDYFSDSKDLDFDLSVLRPLVLERLESARNSIAYGQIIINNGYLISATDHLNNAAEAYNNGELIYALFESLKARAEANLLMELRGFENISSRIDFKRVAAMRAISRSMNRGYLPLLSLSFLEYSMAFVKEDPYQSLLFLAYSKEFASLGSSLNEYIQYSQDNYQPHYIIRSVFNADPVNHVLILILGFIIGVILNFSGLGLTL